MTDATPAPAPSSPGAEPNSRYQLVTLSEPVMRGEQRIEKLNIRKPQAGELRGLNMREILSSDVDAFLALIPRVTDPPLTADETAMLEPEDFSEIAGTIRGFFMTKAERQSVEMLMAEQLQKT